MGAGEGQSGKTGRRLNRRGSQDRGMARRHTVGDLHLEAGARMHVGTWQGTRTKNMNDGS